MVNFPENVRTDRTRQWVKLMGAAKIVSVKRWKSADELKEKFLKDKYFKKNLIGEVDQTEDWFSTSFKGLKNIPSDQKIYIKGDLSSYRTLHLFEKAPFTVW